MKNSRKTAVLLAALLSVSLCAWGPVEEAADSVSETKDTTTAEALQRTISAGTVSLKEHGIGKRNTAAE